MARTKQVALNGRQPEPRTVTSKEPNNNDPKGRGKTSKQPTRKGAASTQTTSSKKTSSETPTKKPPRKRASSSDDQQTSSLTPRKKPKLAESSNAPGAKSETPSQKSPCKSTCSSDNHQTTSLTPRKRPGLAGFIDTPGSSPSTDTPGANPSTNTDGKNATFSGLPTPDATPEKPRATENVKRSVNATPTRPALLEDPFANEKIEDNIEKTYTVLVGSGRDEQSFTITTNFTNLEYFKHHLPTTPDATAIKTPELAAIGSVDLDALKQYIQEGDYSPKLAESAQGPHLIGTRSENQFHRAADKAGLLWETAVKLRLTGLQQLIRRKIQAQWPLDDKPLLALTAMVWWNKSEAGEASSAEVGMQQTLKTELTARYYSLMARQGIPFSGILEENKDLASAIHKALVDDTDRVIAASDEDDAES